MTDNPFDVARDIAPRNTILLGDCLERLRTLPDACVDCCVTSPPYFQLRSYLPDDHPDKLLEIGLEQTLAEYIQRIIAVFEEVRRVLKPTGVCFLNIGDKYANDAKWGGATGGKHAIDLHGEAGVGRQKVKTGFKTKDMMLIPERLKIALQEAGWWVRDTIIWVKGREYADCDIGLNPMPGSQKDRCTPAYEPVIMLTKRGKGYYFDWQAIAEPPRMKPGNGWNPAGSFKRENSKRGIPQHGQAAGTHRPDRDDIDYTAVVKVMPRNVWPIPARGFKESHYATFPPELVSRCVRVGSSAHGCCSVCGKPYIRASDKRLVAGPKAAKTFVQDGRDDGEGMGGDQGSNRQRDGHKSGHRLEMRTTGWQASCECGAAVIPALILDPFFGAGTVGLVAEAEGRDWLGCELNAEYVEMAWCRITAARKPQATGLFQPGGDSK